MTEAQFLSVYRLLEQAFPETERRTLEGQKKLLELPQYHPVLREENGLLIGFLAAWEFSDFCYIEHLCIHPSKRGGGLGGQMLSDYLASSSRPVVLEVEPPDTEICRRRIAFYIRYGFSLNSFPYKQPPLRKGGKSIPLRIMSWPEPLSEDQFQAWKTELLQVVFQNL